MLDQKFNPSGYIEVRHVIDGQQRLTTLQLLIDAAQEVMAAHGLAMDASALHALVLNDGAVAQDPDEIFKVWPTTRDQGALRAVMTNGTVVPAALADSAIARAHQFFTARIRAWAAVDGEPEVTQARLHALAQAVAHHLKVVLIDLEPGDNAQVIFETLNHRGSPLLAADLIKNLLFQVAATQKMDLENLYADFWEPFDNDFWRALIAQGRLYRPRVDVFLNYWLTMKLQREIATDRIFVEFRDRLLDPGRPIDEVMAELAADAKVFAGLDQLTGNSVPGLFYYRVIKALDSAVITPFLLWILRWEPEALPPAERDRALQAMESWLVRRALCRLTSGDINKTVVELIRTLNRTDHAQVGQATEDFFGRARAASRLWPDDDWVISTASTEVLYTGLTRPRLRMLLEALEDDARSQKSEVGRCPRNLTVEHIMPQAWREHWSADGIDDSTASRRDRIIQTLGNLTLVNSKLNPALSNRPWTAQAATERGLGTTGKRDALLEHSVLKLNAKLVTAHPDAWTETHIQVRGKTLATRLTAIWPRPVGLPENAPDLSVAQAQIPEHPVDLPTADQGMISSSDFTGKYKPLWSWLREQDSVELPLTFADVEMILGFELPASARNYVAHWHGTDGTALGRAIQGAGWRSSGVNLTAEKVSFVRIPPTVTTWES